VSKSGLWNEILIPDPVLAGSEVIISTSVSTGSGFRDVIKEYLFSDGKN